MQKIEVPKSLCEPNFTYSELKILLYYFAHPNPSDQVKTESIAKLIKLSKRGLIDTRLSLVKEGYLTKSDRVSNGITPYFANFF